VIRRAATIQPDVFSDLFTLCGGWGSVIESTK